ESHQRLSDPRHGRLEKTEEFKHRTGYVYAEAADAMMTRLMILVLAAAPAFAETAVQHLLETKMFGRLKALDEKTSGVLGVASIDLTSGRIFVYNGEAVLPTASSIKIPILVEMFESVKNLDAKVTLQPAEAVSGSGNLQNELKKGPVTLSVR